TNPVLDVDGNELQRGQLYYATSVMRPGGGLTLAAPKGSCPLNVAQAPFDEYSGRPLAFFPENADDDTVQEGSTLYIMFPEPTRCPQSTVWTFDREAGFVTTGGTTSKAIGPHNSRFAIRKAGDASSQPRDYQIEVCPCSTGVERPSCRMGCLGTLGLAEGGKNVLLNINNESPHTIRFVKVKEG
uniref:Trypsin/chymotrypsin inhibitor n=1 Tax=Alocasia macrorrhizos TaxID=4456 RepID=ITC_ALOMA|nr:RecName: Full=Trypsin/chymotrypsin inhibitor [Alocasia macrorrhizos]5WVX_A Chain A, Trypsin/chymotrypsin inhibitor [Alocasia macrorrhizos]5WVX_B Chain B, Trypsin/chymotrypsin inhibitor [Alocasia macrorrhizos]5YCZ_A Chain A, Trypsin/chymotrypsin inhibitor [Alocasia macrorrhizos]5YCZ_B Chain B, Trypsin/chymotrypsin inhibitor [Alocasia macrorrhizos]